MPGIILQCHFLLHFTIVDLNRTKALHGICGIYSLTGFPIIRKVILGKCEGRWSLVVQYMSVSSIIYSVLPRRV